MKIKSESIELVDINTPVPYEKNMHLHTDEQIDRLIKLIEYQGFRNPLVLQKGTNRIAAGHGRLVAAKKMGMEKVPVIYQEFESEEQFYAYVVSDNAIGKDTWAQLDFSQINKDIIDLGPDLDLDMLGLKDFVVEPLDKLEIEDSNYTRKIEPPVYEPTGEKPELALLVSYEKTQELLKRIDQSSVSQEEKHFLRAAAGRHSIFNYENIANYYAHSNKEMQELMEDSALVIIDFNKAIEQGFVKLTQEVLSKYDTQ